MKRHSSEPWRTRSLRSRATLSASLRPIDVRVLAGALALVAVLAAYRFYDYWTTGFFVSDEFGYFFDAAHGQIYSDRWFFGWLNIYIFKALGVTSVDPFSYLLPFYIFFWAATTLIVFHKLLKLLGFDELTRALSIASCFVLISFVLLSLGFLTEPVGLCMAMIGVYLLARFMKSDTVRGAIAFPFLSACFFGFAAGTREPYNAFLIAGVVIVLFLAFAKRKEGRRGWRMGKRALVLLSVVVFIVPSIFFLYVPTQAYTQQVAPLTSQLVQAIGSNPSTSGGAITITTTTTFASTITNTVTVGNTTTTTTTVTTATKLVSGSPYPFYKRFVLTNMLAIFFGGIFLGWGPICFIVGLAGFLLLVRSLRRRDATRDFLFLTSLTALGSYFIVSFLYAPDPTYFSFQNYSTLIRFSDTALPAYFLLAPLVMLRVAKSKKRATALVAVFVAFLLVAVPVYQVYAASNFNYTSSANPFQLGYRSDAVLLRNYFSNAGTQTVDLVGLPYGWAFTPGVQDLRMVRGYSVGPSPIFPHLGVDNFTSYGWSVLYLYKVDPQPASLTPQSLLQLVTQLPPSNATVNPGFTLSGVQAVLTGPDFVLYKVQLVWP